MNRSGYSGLITIMKPTSNLNNLLFINHNDSPTINHSNQHEPLIFNPPIRWLLRLSRSSSSSRRCRSTRSDRSQIRGSSRAGSQRQRPGGQHAMEQRDLRCLPWWRSGLGRAGRVGAGGKLGSWGPCGPWIMVICWVVG